MNPKSSMILPHWERHWFPLGIFSGVFFSLCGWIFPPTFLYTVGSLYLRLPQLWIWRDNCTGISWEYAFSNFKDAILKQYGRQPPGCPSDPPFLVFTPRCQTCKKSFLGPSIPAQHQVNTAEWMTSVEAIGNRRTPQLSPSWPSES